MELLPPIDMVRIPIIRNVLDFREHFICQSEEGIPLGSSYLEEAWRQREELRCLLTKCSQSSPRQQWISLAKEAIQKTGDYLAYWHRLDSMLCSQGEAILEKYPNGVAKRIPFAWRGPIIEASRRGESVEDSVISYYNAPAFETAMLQVTLAILKWFVAHTYAVGSEDFLSARHNYTMAACDFAYCATFLESRIPYTPRHCGQYTAVRCLDPKLYSSLSQAMNAAAEVCTIYSECNLEERNAAALLFSTGQMYETACVTLTESKQIQSHIQTGLFRTCRTVLICSVLRAAQLLDADTTKTLGRHAWATSIVETVFHYTSPAYDYPALVDRVTWWRQHFWKQNSDVYRNNVPIATDGNGGMKSAIEVLTPYLLVIDEQKK